MSENDIVVEAFRVIKNRKHSPKGRWHLVYFEKKLHCVPAEEYTGLTKALISFRDFEAREGFKESQWNKIRDQIRKLQEAEKS